MKNRYVKLFEQWSAMNEAESTKITKEQLKTMKMSDVKDFSDETLWAINGSVLPKKGIGIRKVNANTGERGLEFTGDSLKYIVRFYGGKDHKKEEIEDGAKSVIDKLNYPGDDDSIANMIVCIFLRDGTKEELAATCNFAGLVKFRTEISNSPAEKIITRWGGDASIDKSKEAAASWDKIIAEAA